MVPRRSWEAILPTSVSAPRILHTLRQCTVEVDDLEYHLLRKYLIWKTDRMIVSRLKGERHRRRDRPVSLLDCFPASKSTTLSVCSLFVIRSSLAVYISWRLPSCEPYHLRVYMDSNSFPLDLEPRYISVQYKMPLS